ncbi:hypothetical protein Tco_1038639 [Tanacetum coccineum]
MIDCLSIVETDKVIHTVETGILKLVVEIKSFDMNSDEFDKETGSSDGLQPKQADLSCVHALNKLHLHEIRVVPRVNSKYFLGLVTPFSSIVGQMSRPFSTNLLGLKAFLKLLLLSTASVKLVLLVKIKSLLEVTAAKLMLLMYKLLVLVLS